MREAGLLGTTRFADCRLRIPTGRMLGTPLGKGLGSAHTAAPGDRSPRRRMWRWVAGRRQPGGGGDSAGLGVGLRRAEATERLAPFAGGERCDGFDPLRSGDAPFGTEGFRKLLERVAERRQTAVRAAMARREQGAADEAASRQVSARGGGES